MTDKIVFVNGKSKCGCVMDYSDGGGEYSNVHTISPCHKHSAGLDLRAAITEARIEGAHFVANRMLAAWHAGFVEDTAKNASDIARMILASTEFMADAPEGDFDRSFADSVLDEIAVQLRREAAR